MTNKIAQKILGYGAATALCLAGAGYAGYKASKEPVAPKEITYVNAIQNSFNAGVLRDDPIQTVIDANKIRFEKIKANPELTQEISALEKSILQMPLSLRNSSENKDYNLVNNYVQEQIGKIRETHQTEKGRYTGAAIALGALASSVAALGYLDISDKKRKEREMKEFLSKVYKPKYERNTEPIVFVDYRSKK